METVFWITVKMDKFNLIIPTRQRSDTLIHTLATVVNSDYDNLNIYISDNNSSDDTRDVVKSFADNRIIYLNTDKRLSMSGNYEFALSHIEDGWVSYLGDDDGLMPNAISNLVALANEAKVEAVSSNYSRFHWGDSEKDVSGKLFIPQTGVDLVYQSQTQLKKLLFGEARFPSSYTELPWLYHGGAAKAKLINRARHVNGKFFLSPIPDVYSSVAISRVVGRFLSIGTPLFISGNSKHSIGVSQTKFFPSKLDLAAFNNFVQEFDFPFDSKYVLGKSLTFIIYEAFFKSQFLEGDIPTPSIEEQVKFSLKFSGKNLPYIFKESIETLIKNNSFSVNPLLFGAVEWCKYNFLTKKPLTGQSYELPAKYNIADAIKFLVDKHHHA